MSPLLQLLIILGALGAVFYILHRLRSLRVRMEDTIFWICFCVLLVVLAVFPKVAYFFCRLLGIQSPVNLIFLLIIALLLEKLFTLSMQVSLLEEKLTVLTAEVALRCKDIEQNQSQAMNEEGKAGLSAESQRQEKSEDRADR